MVSIGLPSGVILRLATIKDVPRTSAVATAGFFYSPAFEWERRYHAQYPEDTIKSFAKRFADIIRDPEFILGVVEDSYQPDENSKTGATIVTNQGEKAFQAGDSVIVGFAAWKLPPGSKYIGQFMDHEDLAADNRPVFDGGLGRDKYMPGSPVYEAVSAQEEKHFQGRMVIELVAIHPAYWRRGHARSLLSWGIAVAESEEVKTGVVANTRGLGLYLSMGFKEVLRFSIQDEDEPPNVISGILLKYPD
ncbi:uncharacterized protein K444DRAFT_573157 [Hyaloscypha bicolor E]|uniref:N-acetyltransferase domain-containing protein n=1 Tax=Hyaloscypha bicolor E TaxID=1095630 RepID=A0A2J6SNP0_9HELO|nr:uncharacterized protein K444DRAFT_573157 [Hyaloscypha bicolor E]PMD52391.1 hypothetical protein K444DRAFT_573157 [Hyaloscypha bicolor E]